MTDPVQAHRAGGPAPLGLHLAQASAIVQGAAALAPVLHDPRAPWHRALSREAARLDAPRPECVLEVGMERLRETLRGIEMWQRHPWRRDLPEPPAVWSEGSTRLLDFGQVDGAPQPMGPPVLVIPSLINRADVLDLTRERSFLRALAQGGWRPLLLDWGAPGEDERGFALDDYIATRLRPALAAARVAGGRPCPVIGYCMGGTIAAGLAARFPADVSALVTLGAPWDFSAVSEPSERIAAALRQDGGLAARAAIRQMGLAFGAVPAVLFQTLFALLDFGLVFRKFRRFAALDQSSAEAKLFVALEDWLEDGVDLTPGVAETVLVDWHVFNTTGMGRWSVLGRTVDPGDIRVPTLVIAGQRDRIAPPGSAEALGYAVPGAALERPDTGHVGLVVSGQSRAGVVTPVLNFLSQL